MNAERTLVRVGLTVAVAALAARGAAAQTLRDALATAYTTSSELREERAKLREVNERVPQALANTRPTIQAFSSIGTVHERTNLPVAPSINAPSAGSDTTPVNLPRKSYGISLTEPIFRGGRTLAEYREAHALVTAERARLISAEERVLLQAATAYIGLLQARELYGSAAERASVLQAQVDQSKGRFAAGALVRTDLLSAQSSLDTAISALASARAQLAAARLAYVRDIGQPPEEVVFPQDQLPLPLSLDEAQQSALSGPEIEAAEQSVEAARQHVRDVLGEGLPTAAVQGALQHEEGNAYRGERDDIRAVIVQLRVPLYAGGIISSRVRAARADVDLQQATLDRLRATTAASVAAAWEKLASTNVSLTAYQAKKATDTLSLQGIRAQLAGGERTPQDVRSAEQTLVETNTAFIGAQKDNLSASFELLAAIGRLTVQSLALPVDRYDPDADYRRVHLGPGR